MAGKKQVFPIKTLISQLDFTEIIQIFRIKNHTVLIVKKCSQNSETQNNTEFMHKVMLFYTFSDLI